MARSKKTTKATTTPNAPADDAPAPASSAKGGSKERKTSGDDEKDAASCHTCIAASSSTAHEGYYPPKPRYDMERKQDPHGDMVIQMEYICKTCLVSKFRRFNDSNTSGLASHTKVCKGQKDEEDAARTLNELGFVPTEAGSTEILQQWIVEMAENARPFKMCEDKALQPLLSVTARKQKITRKQVATGIDDLSRYGKEEMVKEMKRAEGGIYLPVDAWSPPNSWGLMGVTATYRRRNNKGIIESVTRPLDFVLLFASHTGAHMAEVLIKTVEEFQIEDKLIGITGDSASNNLKLMDEIGSYHRFEGRTTFVRCILHVINLISKPFRRSVRAAVGAMASVMLGQALS
ncbi:hypothetical protein JCM8097_004735 [Rhodosporidiobolus ruineniae]